MNEATFTLTGTVTDENGAPLYLAHVATMRDGIDFGTVTDIDGGFTVDALPGEQYAVSYVGRSPVTFTAQPGDPYAVTLAPNATLPTFEVVGTDRRPLAALLLYLAGRLL